MLQTPVIDCVGRSDPVPSRIVVYRPARKLPATTRFGENTSLILRWQKKPERSQQYDRSFALTFEKYCSKMRTRWGTATDRRDRGSDRKDESASEGATDSRDREREQSN
jgi:hypothetical protein